MFGQEYGFLLRCFISAESIFWVPCNSSLLQACSGLSLLVADPSLLFVENSPCLHLELLKGQCKYWIFINGLFPSKMLSKMPAAKDLELVRRDSFLSVFRDLTVCSYLFYQWRKERFYPACYEAWRFSWVKASSLLGKCISGHYV